MIDTVTKDSLTKILQKEFIRRSLVKFFEEKGYDNFLVKPYPPTLLNMPERIPFLEGVTEVKYNLEDIDMKTSTIKVAWNLFVLGNKRTFLGYTTHGNLTEIETGINSVSRHHDGPITLKAITEVIVEMLGSSNKIKDIYQQAKGFGDNTTMTGNSVVQIADLRKPLPDFRRRV
jgi:hypothetical protein